MHKCLRPPISRIHCISSSCAMFHLSCSSIQGLRYCATMFSTRKKSSFCMFRYDMNPDNYLGYYLLEPNGRRMIIAWVEFAHKVIKLFSKYRVGSEIKHNQRSREVCSTFNIDSLFFEMYEKKQADIREQVQQFFNFCEKRCDEEHFHTEKHFPSSIIAIFISRHSTLT